MKTDFNKLGIVETAMLTWAFVGMIVIGAVTFNSLTPNSQKNVTKAFTMFDMHETIKQVADTALFVYDAPKVFYEEFYIAFVDLTKLPPETFEVAKATRIAFNNLADQVTSGYSAVQELQIANAQIIEPQPEGKVAGAMIDLSVKLETMTVSETKPRTKELKMPYSFVPIDLSKIQFTQRLVEAK